MKLDLTEIDKPIADYTIKEWQEYCENTECFSNDGKKECVFYKMCVKVKMSNISGFDLTETPRFTSEQIEKLKALKILFPDVESIRPNTISALINRTGTLITFNNFEFGGHIGEIINIDEVLKEYEV
jgi:hypothetical protein